MLLSFRDFGASCFCHSEVILEPFEGSLIYEIMKDKTSACDLREKLKRLISAGQFARRVGISNVRVAQLRWQES